MSKNVNLKRTVFDKAKFNETVDTNFTQLQSELDPQFFDLSLATQEDFWSLYEKFFYEIPKLGDINSHEYLVKTSGEYINFNTREEEIAALQNEITNLRQQLLEEQIATVEALTGQSINITGSNENVVSTGVSGNALNNSGLSNTGPGTGGNAGGVY